QITGSRTALYHHFASVPPLFDGHMRQHLIAYFDRDDPWHEPLFNGFVEWFDERGQAVVVGFDRFALARGPVGVSGRDGGDVVADLVANLAANLAANLGAAEPVVDQARPTELDAAVAIIRAQLPEVACAAFDIDASELD